MTDAKYGTAEEILAKAKTAEGKKFRDIDHHGRLAKGKGSIGNVIEESFFEYQVNNRAEPDFKEAGIELKVTPYIKNGAKIHAKERLVLNIINYEKEYRQSFETSSFWHKNQKLLLMFYEYIKGVEKGDLSIHKSVLYEYPEKDLLIIRDDWAKIITKIRSGKAHEISEGDTEYLGACTKGATKDTNWVAQPCSSFRAQRRAYCFKQPYMTYLLNTYIFGDQHDENIITSPELLEHQSFEDFIVSKIKTYFGRSQEELCSQLNLKTTSKSINELIISKLLGLNGDIRKTEEFKKAAIVVKTIRVNYNGHIKESMSFPYFDFCELVKEEWDTSNLKTFFESTRFMFVIFKYDKTGIFRALPDA